MVKHHLSTYGVAKAKQHRERGGKQEGKKIGGGEKRRGGNQEGGKKGGGDLPTQKFFLFFSFSNNAD